jgi:hypothetical protein
MRQLQAVLVATLLIGGSWTLAAAARAQAAAPPGSDDQAAAAALIPFMPLFMGPPHVYAARQPGAIRQGEAATASESESEIGGESEKRFRPSQAVLMHFNGGNVLTASKTVAIFWGPQWNDPTFESDVIPGIDTFLGGFGGSNYAGNSTEYGGANGKVTRSSTYLGHVIDPVAVPAQPVPVDMVGAEACKIANFHPDPDALYLVYTSSGAGNVKFCGYHAWGQCGSGEPIQIAFLPNLAGIAGCSPNDVWTKHSPALAAVANVTAHELSEVITDPRGGGWYDPSGGENGDKCAWVFQGPVTLSGGSVWKLQMLWSNNAYSNSTGQLNRSRQRGCLQGR